MSQPEPYPNDEPLPFDGDHPGARVPPPARPANPVSNLWLWAMAGGLLAGLIAWTWDERTYETFRPVFVAPANWAKMNGYEKADYRSADEIRQKPLIAQKNGLLVFGALGLLFGGLLGLAGGLARGAAREGAAAAVLGAAAGVAAAAIATWVSVPVFYRFVDPQMGVTAPILTHMAIFGAIGAAGGLGLGLGVGGRGKAVNGLLGGLLGGIIGAVVYDMVASILFADMRVYDPHPNEAGSRVPRLVMHLSAALFASAFAAISIYQAKPRPSRSGPSS
jgi:hypothetical protein